MVSKTDIEKTFSAQLSKISDKSIRDKVVDVWVKACERGGWKSVDDILKMPFTILTDTKGVNFIEHTIAVTEGALALAKAQMDNYKSLPYKINIDRLVAGGILHDVGKLLEIEPDGSGGFKKSFTGEFARHPISGAMIADEVGLPDEIVNVIAYHAKEGEGKAQVIETILVHQADFATFNPLVMLNQGLLIK
jgi:putative nucleotidyltransferase with HDIG domain